MKMFIVKRLFVVTVVLAGVVACTLLPKYGASGIPDDLARQRIVYTHARDVYAMNVDSSADSR